MTTTPPPGQPSWAGVPSQRAHPKSNLALLLGIGSMFGSCLGGLPGLLGIVAVLLGLRAIREIDADPATWTGRESAVAGMITGVIGTVLAVAALGFLAVLLSLRLT
ncbi:DUF4190 domain-containing protein [Nocardioides limicola]|uniref:DUF4190 domain-containing protein n=1 Tax=Nocardioides limicola TaxID=2803368 RepID=UPI00193BDD65|nr:DUF4190 domain-containing protein [Nocardioides sp. DJM-14]